MSYVRIPFHGGFRLVHEGFHYWTCYGGYIPFWILCEAHPSCKGTFFKFPWTGLRAVIWFELLRHEWQHIEVLDRVTQQLTVFQILHTTTESKQTWQELEELSTENKTKKISEFIKSLFSAVEDVLLPPPPILVDFSKIDEEIPGVSGVVLVWACMSQGNSVIAKRHLISGW